MPSGPLAHICFVVLDLDKAIEDWRRILGVLDPRQLEEPIVRYDDFTGGDDRMRWATFVSHHGAEIQLIEPAAGTPLGRRLEKVGEHVHHVCFTTPDVPGSMQRLAAAGVELAAKEFFVDPVMDWQRWTWISPKSTHGVLIEVASPYESRDGKWYPTVADHDDKAKVKGP